MKKICLLFSGIVFLCNLSFAQDQTDQPHYSVGVMLLNSSTYSISPVQIQLLTDKVADCFASKSYFTLIDRGKMQQIKTNRPVQNSNDNVYLQITQQARGLGTQYVVTGNITGLTTNKISNSSYDANTKKNVITYMYTGQVDFTLNLIDVSTSTVISTKSFSSQGFKKDIIGKENEFSTPQTAMEAALESAPAVIYPWINSIPAFYIRIVMVKVMEREVKNDLPYMMLISAGTEMNLNKGSKLSVIEHDTLMVNGTATPHDQTIGELKVTKVEDAKFSDCKITDGAPAIDAAIKAKKSCELVIVKY